MKTLRGGCHCKAVQFEVEVEDDFKVIRCNCSICNMTGYIHLVVEGDQFHLRSGEEKLTTYTFNTGTAKHRFCSVCGIKSFYVPRSHPEGYSINVRCLEGVDPDALSVVPFDGQHWEDSIEALRKGL